jgi:type IV pilus assembly protein PilB
VVPVSDFFSRVVDLGVATDTECKDLVSSFQSDTFAMLLHLARKEPHQREMLGRVWGDLLSVAYVDPSKTLIQYELAQRLPESFAKTRKVLPLYEFGGAVTLATAAPANVDLIREVQSHMDSFVSPVFSFPEQISAALDIAYQSSSSLETLLNGRIKSLAGAKTMDAAELTQLSGDQSIIEFAKGMMLMALKTRASDIHIEPGMKTVRIRFRIDGVLQEFLTLDASLLPPIVTRIKLLAQADIGESRKPQDGRIPVQLPDRTVDFRFSCMPTIHGEKIVLRVLGQRQFADVPDIDELDFSVKTVTDIKRAISQPNGIFFVTGPTGSGKSTTLFSLLKYLNNPGVNIITIEDPVEYTLAGVNQVHVNETVDLSFGTALRSFLRQDPDVILVGEIRDGETATIAARAALTGHLVLTTMHTNSALQALTRLLDLEVDPALVGPSIIGVMAQRLVRKLCDNCKEPYDLSDEEIDRYFERDGVDSVTFYRPKGCERCNRTGFNGRTAIHETFLVNEDVRSLLLRNAPFPEIEACAEQHGFQGMRYDAMKKVLRGMTTVEEVNRVVAEE